MQTGEAQGSLAIRHALLHLRCHPSPAVKPPTAAPHMLTGASRSAPGRLQEAAAPAYIPEMVVAILARMFFSENKKPLPLCR